MNVSKKQACALAIWPLFFLTACDKLPKWNSTKPEELAEQSLAAGDYTKAVRYFEQSLDGTPETAAVHFRLALLYDTQLKDDVSALHHYRRYLRLAESGKYAADAKKAIGRIEREFAAKLGEGGLVTRAEAVRLRNENTALRQQIAELRGQKVTPAKTTEKPPVDKKGFSKVTQTREAEKAVGSETRTYTVQKGDTLASISRKFYNSSNRWKDIVDANQNQLQGRTEIYEGQVLIIP
jgi:LysM repeat protein